MDYLNKLETDLNTVNERLAKRFYSSRRYNPILLGAAGIGFLAIFLLTQFGILGEPASQLLYIGGITLLFALAEIPLLALAQQKKGISVHLYGSVIVGLFAVLLTLFWQGIEFITILISFIPVAMALRHGMPRKYLPVFFLILVVTLIGIAYVSANPAVERLNSNSPSAIASIVFLVATSLLLVTITVISQNRRFRSLQGLLLASFVIIVMI
ncbi:MAG: hypothetical protein ACXW4E_05175, partial [Anaerolineales bacterium]